MHGDLTTHSVNCFLQRLLLLQPTSIEESDSDQSIFVDSWLFTLRWNCSHLDAADMLFGWHFLVFLHAHRAIFACVVRLPFIIISTC